MKLVMFYLSTLSLLKITFFAEKHSFKNLSEKPFFFTHFFTENKHEWYPAVVA